MKMKKDITLSQAIVSMLVEDELLNNKLHNAASVEEFSNIRAAIHLNKKKGREEIINLVVQRLENKQIDEVLYKYVSSDPFSPGDRRSPAEKCLVEIDGVEVLLKVLYDYNDRKREYAPDTIRIIKVGEITHLSDRPFMSPMAALCLGALPLKSYFSFILAKVGNVFRI